VEEGTGKTTLSLNLINYLDEKGQQIQIQNLEIPVL